MRSEKSESLAGKSGGRSVSEESTKQHCFAQKKPATLTKFRDETGRQLFSAGGNCPVTTRMTREQIGKLHAVGQPTLVRLPGVVE
jgi:hypothetical protein